ncbi:MAG: DUF58 domain-containing protein [Polyangia bacterium]
MDNEVRQMLRKVRRIDIATRRAANDTFAGRFQSVFRGRGMDFDEVRPYVPGDEVRTIDWNVTARAGAPFVKKYREEREVTILLAIDVSASGDFGSTERTKREIEAEIACLLALTAVRNNDRIGLILYSDCIETYVEPKKGRTHVLRLVREILACKPRHRGTELAQALDFIDRITKRRAIVVLISDFKGGGDPGAATTGLDRALQAVRRKHDLVAMCVQDRHEQTLPDVGLLTLEDAESGEIIEVDTGSAKVRQRYAAAATEERAQLRKTFRKQGIDTAEIDASVPYMPTLVEFFRSRGRRRR